ncbi:hypothetical protein LJC31_00640 [Synergistaceae bacterium OttesenSCG-928-I11]|nr:hypothetical protein [Synergistaceae bacterium OttesenSCG-928-I11]
MAGEKFFRKKLAAKKIRAAAKKEQNRIRRLIKKLEEGLILLDFLISSRFADEPRFADVSFLPWESPDFLLQARKKKIGVELTRAVKKKDAPPCPGEEALDGWLSRIAHRIEAKRKKYDRGTIRLFNANVLLVIDELDVPIEPSADAAFLDGLVAVLGADAQRRYPNRFSICLKLARRRWYRLTEHQGAWNCEPFTREKT